MWLRGARVVGFGDVGAPTPTGTFARAADDLEHQVLDVVTQAGDVYYGAAHVAFMLDFSDAVSSYQAAGQAGATSVGPEIDAAGSSSVTSPITHRAWTLNTQLAALPPSGLPDPRGGQPRRYYTQSDADQARALVVQMIDLYEQAIDVGAKAAGQAVPSQLYLPESPPAPAAQSNGSSALAWIFGFAAAAGGAYLLFSAPRRSHEPAHA